MYRILSIGVSILILGGVLFYLFSNREVPQPAPAPVIPENPTINTPVISKEDFQYGEKMKDVQVKQDEERTQKVNDIEIANNAITASNPESCKEIVSESIRGMCEDRSKEALAIKEKNISQCESIGDATKKQICTDKIYILQAKEKSDTVICDMITDTDLRSQCVSQVEMKKYNGIQAEQSASGGNTNVDCSSYTNTGVASQCRNDSQKKEDYALLTEAMKDGKSSTCSDIHDEKVQSNCYDGIYFTDAKKSLSLKECEKIMSSTIKTQCISTISTITDAKNFQEAIQTQSMGSCEKITSASLRSNCTDRIRLNQIVQSKAGDCMSLSDVSLQEVCKNSIGTN